MTINYTGGSRNQHKPHTSRVQIDETGTPQYSVRSRPKLGRSLLNLSAGRKVTGGARRDSRATDPPRRSPIAFEFIQRLKRSEEDSQSIDEHQYRTKTAGDRLVGLARGQSGALMSFGKAVTKTQSSRREKSVDLSDSAGTDQAQSVQGQVLSSTSRAEAVRGSDVEPIADSSDGRGHPRQVTPLSASPIQAQVKHSVDTVQQTSQQSQTSNGLCSAIDFLLDVNVSTSESDEFDRLKPVSWLTPLSVSSAWRNSNPLFKFDDRFEALDEVVVFDEDNDVKFEKEDSGENRKYLHERMGLGSRGLTRQEFERASSLGFGLNWEKWWSWFEDEEEGGNPGEQVEVHLRVEEGGARKDQIVKMDNELTQDQDTPTHYSVIYGEYKFYTMIASYLTAF
ncbi:hypothetical protein OIV83_003853 [Microbotryomycetes sp. JL201]|nr:hypothetical protein OIV83_003853 [Microbotryomycetes sp. JL201]